MTLRALLRAPAPALALGVVATLAVGVGALTATFAVVRAALLRPPPFDDARALAVIKLVRRPTGEPERREDWSYPRFEMLRDLQRSFERVATYGNPSLTLSGLGDVELVQGEVVSASYFPLLRVGPARGRVLVEGDDDVRDPAPVALVSHALWARRWGSDPSLVGRVVRVNGVPLAVVGVLPDGFRGLSGRADVWLPTALAPRLTYADYVRTNQNFITVVGRLRDGVSLDDARRELAALGAAINRAAPSDPAQPGERVSATAVSLNEARVNRLVRRALTILSGAVTVLYLLACANVTNLLLGDAARRRRESAVRAAIGCGAGRLFRHALGEQLAIVVPGGALGVLLAWWATLAAGAPAAVWASSGVARIAPFDTPSFGGAELAFGLTLAAVTALLVTAPAAPSALRLDVQAEIKAGSQGIAGGAIRLGRPTARGVLVALEATLAVVLVVTAGLLVESYRRVRRIELGVAAPNVLTFWTVPPEASVPPGGAAAYVARVLDAVARVPGVRSASVDGGAPLIGTARAPLYVAGRPAPPAGEAPVVLRHYVGPDHFRTLGIPLRRGRALGPGDDARAPRVVVISEGAARRFWPGEDPIGKRVAFGAPPRSPDSTAVVVGVVGDVAYEPLDRPANPASFYTPYAQFTYASRLVLLRTSGDPLAVVRDVRRALHDVDPDLAMRDVRTLDAIVRAAGAGRGVGAALSGAFGVAALLLAASGIFAVLAHAVATRTRELGVRIALGADPVRVVRLVLADGLAFPLVGVAAGVVASLAASRVLRAALYEVSPLDPAVFAGTIALLLLAAVAACVVPAWRATRTEPSVVLRGP